MAAKKFSRYRVTMRCASRLAATAALAASVFASSASAETTAAKLWDGAFTITQVTQQCLAAGYTPFGSWRALYRARLKPTEPKAAIIVQTDNLNHTFVIRAVSNTVSMQGTDEYCGIEVDPRKTEPVVWNDGSYTINVTPKLVTQSTRDIRVTGSVTKFANVEGCNISFRAAFLRRP